MMTKFKKGDWVRVVDLFAARVTGLAVGGVYKVDDVIDDLVYVGSSSGLYARRFEPWQPKVGDRVRFTDKVPSHWFFGPTKEYKEGVISNISDGDLGYVVETGDTFGYVDLEHIEPITLAPVVAPVAAEAQPTLTIRAGKFYKTRDGRKVGPMVDFEHKDGYPWCDEKLIGAYYSDSGKPQYGSPDNDLIAEWVDEPVAVAASNDNAAPAKPKFKVGDRVRVVKAGDTYQEKYIGTTFTIDSDEGDFDGEKSWAGRDHESPYRWKETQLEFAPLVTPPAIVCLIEDGQPLPSARPFVHKDEQSAAKEASRLAGVHKGKEFGVYVLTSTAKEERTYDHEWQRLAAKGEKINAIRELRSEHTFLSLRSAKDFVEDFLRAA